MAIRWKTTKEATARIRQVKNRGRFTANGRRSSQFGVRRLDAALDEGQASDCSHQADPARRYQRFKATGCVPTAGLEVTT